MSDLLNITGLKLVRKDPRADRTLGEMLVEYDGNGDWRPFAWVVEDKDRMLRADQPLDHIKATKVRAQTCIPSGRYRLAWTLSPSRGVHTLRLLDVPGFQGILVHSGNGPEHTEGCICPGLQLDRQKGVTSRSKEAVAWLEKHLPPLLADGREIWITVERAYDGRV